MNSEQLTPKISNEDNLEITGGLLRGPRLEVKKITNQWGGKVENESDLSPEGNKAEILVIFWNGENDIGNKSGKLSFSFQEKAWNSNKDWEDSRKNSLLKYLDRKGLSQFNGKINSNLNFELIRNGKDIDLKISSATGNLIRTIVNENLKVEERCWIYSLQTLQKWSKAGENGQGKGFIGWIIFFVIVVALSLTAFFLFKRNKKKDKKTKEQLDIF